MKSLIVDSIIRNSYWYKDRFEDAERILSIQKGLDIMNVGSNQAKYGIDYSECGLRGGNFAVGPQTLTFDFLMLRKYSSYLGKKGPRILLIILCPFNLCLDTYRPRNGEVYKNVRYYRILDKGDIPNFDATLYDLNVEHPSKKGLKALYHALRQRHTYSKLAINQNNLSPEQMLEDANRRIDGWMREFDLTDLNPNHLSPMVEQSILYNKGVIDKIVSFCKDNRFKLFVVAPPISKELSGLIPDGFKERCLNSIIKEKNIQFLDYTNDEGVNCNEYFLDSFFLNKTGRVKFTNRIVKDIYI